MTEDPAFYDRALRRIDRFALACAVIVLVAMGLRQGWHGALGAAGGACFALFSLRGWKRVAWAVSSDAGRRPGIGMGVRYILLGASLLVIIKFLDVSAYAVLAGLMVSVAAVIIEIVYELITS